MKKLIIISLLFILNASLSFATMEWREKNAEFLKKYRNSEEFKCGSYSLTLEKHEMFNCINHCGSFDSCKSKAIERVNKIKEISDKVFEKYEKENTNTNSLSL
jgi:hypothetical protein